MRALIICSAGTPTENADIPELSIAPLMPLVDRPFVQHVVEKCLHLGATSIDMIVESGEAQYKDLFGDGKRWGCPIRYSAISTFAAIGGAVAELGINSGELCLLARADRIPSLDKISEGMPELYIDSASEAWTGWAHLTASTVVSALEGDTSALIAVPTRSMQSVLSCSTPGDLLKAQRAVLDGHFVGLMLSGREVEPGVRLGRNANVHPSAKLTAPVYVGENSRVGAGAVVGPNSVIARDCIVDRGNIMAESLICTGTYVGEELEIRNAIISGNRVINVEIGSATKVVDPGLLSRLPVK